MSNEAKGRVGQKSWGLKGYTMGENTNVVSSPPEIKVSPSLVQLRAFTHLASKSLGTEVCQQRLSLSLPKKVWGRERGGISAVSYGNLPGMAF